MQFTFSIVWRNVGLGGSLSTTASKSSLSNETVVGQKDRRADFGVHSTTKTMVSDRKDHSASEAELMAQEIRTSG